jgi:hypothetical protein
MAHIDRRAVFLQSAFDDLDGAHDTGAETARLSEDHFHLQNTSRSMPDCGDAPQQRPAVARMMYVPDISATSR